MYFFKGNIKVDPSAGAVQHASVGVSSEVKIEPNKQGHQNSYTLTIGKEKFAVYGEKADIDQFEKLLKNNPQAKDFKISVNDKYQLKINLSWYSSDVVIGLSRETSQSSMDKLSKFLGKETPLLQFYPVQWGSSGKGLSLGVLKNNPEAAKNLKIEPGDGKYLIKSHQGGTITIANSYQDALSMIVKIRESIGQTSDQEYFNFKAQLLVEKKDANGLIKHLGSNRSAAAAFVDKYQPGLIDSAIWSEKKYAPIKFAQDERAHQGLAKVTEDKSTKSQADLELIYKALVQSGNRPLAGKFFDRLPAGLKDFKLTTIEKYAERGQRAVQSTMAGLEKMDKAQLKVFIQDLKKNPNQVLPAEMMKLVLVNGKEHAKAQIEKIIVESEKILKQIEENEKAGQKGDVAILPRLLAILAPDQSADLIDDYSLSAQTKTTYQNELNQIDFFAKTPTPQKKLELLNKYISGLDENQKKILEEKFGLKLPLDEASAQKMELIPLKFLTKGGGKEGVTYFLGIKNPNGTANYINLSELQMLSNVPEKINIYKEIKNRSELFNTFGSHNALPRVSYYIGIRENGSVNVVASQELGKQINEKVKEYSAYVLMGAGLVATFATGGAGAAAGGLLIAGALHQLADSAYDIYVGQKYGTMSLDEFKSQAEQMGMTVAMMATGPIKGFKGTLIRTGLMIPDSIHTYQTLNDPNLSQAEKNEALAFFALNTALFLWAEKGSLKTHLLEMKSKNPRMYRELSSMGINENAAIPTSGAKKWLQDKMTGYLDKEISKSSNKKIASGIELHSYGPYKPLSGKETIGFYDGKKAIKIQKNELKAYYEIERGTPGNMAKFERAGAVNTKTGEMIRPDQEFFAMNLPREKFPEMIKILENKNPAQFEKFCRENNVVFRGLESEGHVSTLKVFENYHSEKNTASIASEDSNVINGTLRKQIGDNKDLVRFEVQPQGTRPSVSDTAEGGLVFIRGEKNSQGKIVYAKEGFVKEKLASAAQTLAGTKGVQNKALSRKEDISAADFRTLEKNLSGYSPELKAQLLKFYENGNGLIGSHSIGENVTMKNGRTIKLEGVSVPKWMSGNGDRALVYKAKNGDTYLFMIDGNNKGAEAAFHAEHVRGSFEKAFKSGDWNSAEELTAKMLEIQKANPIDKNGVNHAAWNDSNMSPYGFLKIGTDGKITRVGSAGEMLTLDTHNGKIIDHKNTKEPSVHNKDFELNENIEMMKNATHDVVLGKNEVLFMGTDGLFDFQHADGSAVRLDSDQKAQYLKKSYDSYVNDPLKRSIDFHCKETVSQFFPGSKFRDDFTVVLVSEGKTTRSSALTWLNPSDPKLLRDLTQGGGLFVNN